MTSIDRRIVDGFHPRRQSQSSNTLPESVEDHITEDTPVRFIDSFAGSLDLAELGFTRVNPADTGRPDFDPADLLRLYIYGYLNRVPSSRMLEREAKVKLL